MVCIVEYLRQVKTNQDFAVASLDLFLICTYGRDSLYSKLSEVLNKAEMHPFHSSIFSSFDYQGGGDYLISEFQHFAALFISSLVDQYPAIISPSLRNEYQTAKEDIRFSNVTVQEVRNKMFFISKIIGSILDDF